jgi:hypothetical protein
MINMSHRYKIRCGPNVILTIDTEDRITGIDKVICVEPGTILHATPEQINALGHMDKCVASWSEAQSGVILLELHQGYHRTTIPLRPGITMKEVIQVAYAVGIDLTLPGKSC